MSELSPEQKIEADALDKRVLSEAEKSFTSTGDKLNHHPALLRDLQNRTPHVVSFHLMPTDICNLACSFCSVADRNSPYQELKKSSEFVPDGEKEYYARDPFLDFESEIKPAVSALKKWGAKAVILSGGGEPTVYRDRKGSKFSDLIKYLRSESLEVALITNGTQLAKLGKEIRDELSWMRVSWYPFQYSDKYNEDFDIPVPGEKTTIGYSIVVTDMPSPQITVPLGEKELYDLFEPVVSVMNKHGQQRGAKYVRLVPDCHVHGNDHMMLHRVSERLEKNVGGIVLHQQKYHRPPSNCFMGYVRPVVYANGLVFPCDSLILNDASDRRFHPSYAMCKVGEIDKFFTEQTGKLKSLIENPYQKCPKCVFFKNNERLQGIVDGSNVPPVSNEPLEHVNFI